LLELTRQRLDQLIHRQKKGSAEKLGAQVGRVLEKYKMGKFIQWQVKEGRLEYQIKEAVLTQEQLLDGCYIVQTTVGAPQMSSKQVVHTYKSLALVEQAFRSLKTVALEIRPIYRQKDERIRSDVLLCVLAYYLYWHPQQRWQPLFEQLGIIHFYQRQNASCMSVLKWHS
jgi:transposase